mgnify:CR=1 FL=1|jgi:hypothetical protein
MISKLLPYFKESRLRNNDLFFAWIHNTAIRETLANIIRNNKRLSFGLVFWELKCAFTFL